MSQTRSIVVLDSPEILPLDLGEVELFKLVLVTRIAKLVGPLVSLGAKYELCTNYLILLSQ